MGTIQHSFETAPFLYSIQQVGARPTVSYLFRSPRLTRSSTLKAEIQVRLPYLCLCWVPKPVPAKTGRDAIIM